MSKENMTQHDIDLIAAQRKGHDTGYLQGAQMAHLQAAKKLQALQAELERVALERDEARVALEKVTRERDWYLSELKECKP